MATGGSGGGGGGGGMADLAGGAGGAVVLGGGQGGGGGGGGGAMPAPVSGTFSLFRVVVDNWASLAFLSAKRREYRRPLVSVLDRS